VLSALLQIYINPSAVTTLISTTLSIASPNYLEKGE